MHKILIIIVGFVFLFGCAEIGEKAANEIGTCLDKCQSLCSLAKNSSLDLDGFQSVKLTKQAGGVSVSCSCTCY